MTGYPKSNHTVAYRLWQLRQKEDFYTYDISYMDSTNAYSTDIPGPRYDILASPKITLNNFDSSEISNVTVDYYNCNGEVVTLFDNYNQAAVYTSDCSTTIYPTPVECRGNQMCKFDFLNGYYTMNVIIFNLI